MTVAGEVLAGGEAEEAAERWAWDLNGYLVLPGLMSEEWCRSALAAVEANTHLIKDRTHERTFPRDLEGSDEAGSRALTELLALPPPHDAPFATMMAHPGVLKRVQWMLGGKARVNHWGAGQVAFYPVPEMAAFYFDKGHGGDRLHGGAPGTNPLPWSKITSNRESL